MASTTRSGRWTRDEHSLYIEGVKLYGKNWSLVAAPVSLSSWVFPENPSNLVLCVDWEGPLIYYLGFLILHLESLSPSVLQGERVMSKFLQY
eukprot:CAMPEP_0204896950 /NCGR_PEP_ID=MMETSP1397-20131031/467_1 /ASSEMBLY_ACC=CAM_ASM_000891 /TAXON_ID=49980 /ORGANISM="Climacostomum Climacostomum virens, Strain Stock W-24" /LENGTH=91 /DNA_ID=CAMNT_0052064645 /DNA_START=254 /DNA_END=529 /DNA_ORIENTATION=+